MMTQYGTPLARARRQPAIQMLFVNRSNQCRSLVQELARSSFGELAVSTTPAVALKCWNT